MRTTAANDTKAAEPRRFRRLRRPSRRFGLRARVALSWALAAGLMVASVGGLTYSIVRRYMLSERDKASARQAYSNARVVRDNLRGPDTTGLVPLLDSLRSEAGSFALVKRNSRWYGTVGGSAELLPTSIKAALDAGVSGRQRFHDGSEPYLAVGVAMPSVGIQYVEVFPQETLRHTLSVLRQALIISALGGLAFGWVFGWWSAWRVLLPLRRTAAAAEAVADGALDTRLPNERDVDLNRLVVSFNAMTDAVQSRIEREARFASDVSHELRTPLGTLSAAVEVLERRRPELPERAQRAVEVIGIQQRRLSSMILDLLEIARIDAGVADVNLQSTDLAGIVTWIADANGVSSDVMSIERRHGSTVAPIDRRRFEQILRNLIDNANKYGSGVERIVVRGLMDCVVVHVDDRGPGVPAEERGQIFGRFARGTSTQDVPGTGLGLALASDQAELMGARIEVTDSPEGGARFSIWLQKDPHADEDAHDPPDHGTTGQGNAVQVGDSQASTAAKGAS